MASTATAPAAGRRPPKPGNAAQPDTSSGKPTSTDRRALKSQAAARNRAEKAAYQAGLANGERPHPEEPDSVHQAFDAGIADGGHSATPPNPPTPAPAPAPTPSAPTSAPSRGSSSSLDVAEEGAGLLLGLIAYALGLNYLRYGWPGVTSWMSAKFLNKPTLATPGQAQTTATVV